MTTVLQFFPDRLDVNGDSRNALVLQARAQWSGIPVTVVPVTADAMVNDIRPGAVVIGSGVDADLRQLAHDFEPWRDRLREWLVDGVPVVAVGTGFELLSDTITFADGTQLKGLGVFPGAATPLPARVSDDLIVDSRFGRIVGYENHSRGLAGVPESERLGHVVSGAGNAHGDGEGVQIYNSLGTHMHGPLLAKNPAIADWVLTHMLGESYSALNPRATRADEIARQARQAIATQKSVALD